MKGTCDTTYWVYILICGRGRIYVGVGADPLRPLAEHRKLRSANMPMNRPHDLIGAVEVGALSEAYLLEKSLKTRSHQEKLKAAANMRQSPSWQSLVERLCRDNQHMSESIQEGR